jgi:hypothetical protein
VKPDPQARVVREVSAEAYLVSPSGFDAERQPVFVVAIVQGVGLLRIEEDGACAAALVVGLILIANIQLAKVTAVRRKHEREGNTE